MQTPIPNVITDTNGIIEFVNDSHCKLSGYKASEVVGKKP
ncbi:MAG: PAS domain S-box protein, partial [Bacteroidales bacterium]|nr:PAS domain S-box protein [Bacteroidales bacterium]